MKYGPGWAALRLKKQTYADPTLTHQVVFAQEHGNGGTTTISCNCRKRNYKGTGHGGPEWCDPIARTRDLDESRRLYNDPANHWERFTEEDRARW